ncbi:MULTISPECIES: DivIVA domain-containing protein [unclassified Arthrobacter]|uniref:DivIVA domain-containing protein n=1 Tax=unclassified Arthrobacter TaxID=235627 RepID=UPI001D133C35|nr:MULTISPECIES: DivIVA domain-containing protein [unclassified Arthrobacter]MCC3274329.1 DivIVA domain-containing protein [Arthrobacter sp. zg-Y20]MCC3279677.1 DivIVA domain-containing protein [Arthrobacter sp. zg-Y40]MCC9178078.1 DivIVA domain-containing protein [Arthrobacter sp. zg-Y750]MDK1314485.1 DivIVA domain-containing protein [Arthrobacter sp. zg.Y20]MDK1327371.1 DivIVA domain-containing protein [Arthrobacter sp. zg-Y1143]
MALTPEDVVNKRFQPTKFREGYDQDEVDDFLDEIVVELRRLNAENEDLRRQLAEAAAGGSVSEKTVPAPVAAASTTEQVREEPKPEPKVEAPRVEERPAPVEPKQEAAPAAPAGNTTETAAGILAMAQKMHDDYVSAGVEQRDKIIAEAQIEASGLVTDAQEKSRKILSTLEQQKAVLERKVEQLRGFERDYRSRLKAYIEGQLRDLDARGSVASETADA